MKLLLACAAVGGAVVLAGCAPAPLTKAEVDGRIVCNTDQMDQVERAARRSHKDLYWINCPVAVLRAV